MPFVVQCPYCKMRARVPDRAVGASGKCARCASSFTLVPADDQRLPELAAAAAASRPYLEPAVEASVPAAVAEQDAPAHAELMAQFDVPPIEADISEPTESDAVTETTDAAAAPGVRVRPEATVGALALLVGGAALVCASVRPICFLVLPLGGLGLLGGLAAIVLARRVKKPRILLPMCGCAASAILLFVALISPGMLGPTYARWRQPSGATSPGMRAIPLAGAALATAPPEWADASKYALQRGDLRLEVVKVSLGPPLGAQDQKHDPPPKGVLLIRLRVKRTQLAELKDRERSCFERSDERPPTLVDDAGRSYELQDNRVFGPAGANHRSSLFPVSAVEEVLVFEPPPAGVQFLKLELPGVEWVGGGVFRFTIPAAMIARDAQPSDAGK
jgi:hypothetical protein